MQNHPFTIGKSYFIRTVTYHVTGRVKEVLGDFLVLEDAAWIADSGRFSQALAGGDLNEVEPIPGSGEWYVNLASIADAGPWPHALPREVK